MNFLYTIFGYPFGFLMSLIYKLVNNYAVSIIIFTVVTKLLLFPVNYKTQKNAARMQLLNPKLEKLKKSYSNNPERLQQEQNKLYQEEGINPMASCLPSLIQMLLLFGVLDVVYKPLTHILRFKSSVRSAAVEIASKLSEAAGGKSISSSNLRSELLTMEQLEKNPSAFEDMPNNFLSRVSEFAEHFTIFGANLGKTPTLHPDSWTKEAIILCAIPFLAGLAQLLFSVYSQIHQKKTNPNMQGGGCMSAMMFGMPLLSVFFAFEVPAGVGFYWIWSSIFSFIITFALNQYFTGNRVVEMNEKEKKKALEYAKKHPEKKSFMQRMMEQAAEQNGTAAPANKNNNGKISRSEKAKQDREALNAARKRYAEKYGDEYDDADDND